MEWQRKVEILADSAKYDVSCSSSGTDRGKSKGMLGTAAAAGICHSWSDDGRCISLLKILMTNVCTYDCAYCVNRVSNDIPRATLTPGEIVDLTLNFYRRNYIEGLFLSSAVLVSPNYTMERMVEVVKKLRTEGRFNGYIHLKAIPGADALLISEAGRYVDRMSLNIELPTKQSLMLLAPEKKPETITAPMAQIKNHILQTKSDQARFRHTPSFVPAGQTTQMIVGATGETDFLLLNLTEKLYHRYALKRVYFSAYVPVVQNHPVLPGTVMNPMLREHRLYQADWLLRFYGYKAGELLDEANPQLDLELDPKCQWALRHPEQFPVEVNTANLDTLLRVPGIGPVSARRILKTRRFGAIRLDDLKGLGVVMKRARYFITCSGKRMDTLDVESRRLRPLLVREEPMKLKAPASQLTFFDLNPGLWLPPAADLHVPSGQLYR
jgi:putative DNA modification/repair radical SAM protein